MNTDPSRQAAVNAALTLLQPGMAIGLGSGRAVFALTERLRDVSSLRAVVASPATETLAVAAGLDIVELTDTVSLDLAFDGADEVDGDLRMIKGGGAAALREKLVLAAAREVVILVEEPKVVERLGSTTRLPVDIPPFAWRTTRQRVLRLAGSAELRMDDRAKAVETAEGNYILDVEIPDTDLRDFAGALKGTLGVVEHGLFLDEASRIIVGHPDGSVTTLLRP